MSGAISVYITATSREEAEKIAQTVVGEDLAACVNILPDIRSVYRWEGKVEQADECALLAKTTRDKFDALEKRVRSIHSYTCPCIVAWPITAITPDYLAYLTGK